MFPNFSFLDAPFNLQYYKPGRSGDRSRLHGLPHARHRPISYDPTREITYGRGNLSFTSVNLPRIAIRRLTATWTGSSRILTARSTLSSTSCWSGSESSAAKRVRNYPFLMGQGVWIDSEKLGPDDEVGEVLKHGTLTLGFIGLAECLKALIGSHHGESAGGAEPGP